MHTLTEQNIDLSSVSDKVDVMKNVFIQQLGYTVVGDTIYSPIDTEFGLKIFKASGGGFVIHPTFDSGITYIQSLFYEPYDYVTKLYYHASINEKVIYLRINFKDYRSNLKSMDFIIAHDEKNKTMVLFGNGSYESSGNNYDIRIMTHSLKAEILTTDNYSNINLKISNAIFRYPSYSGLCSCSELYGVVNVQTFPDAENTFFNFNGNVFRVVRCCNSPQDSTAYPRFAFPVSD